MLTENEVKEVSQKFYQGLSRMSNGEKGVFNEVWGHGSNATAMHPIGGRDLGWDAVRNSFDQVAGAASDGKVELKDQKIFLLGDAAYEIGTEHAGFTLGGKKLTAEIRVTNIYHKDGGKCKMVHHHTDIAPSMVEALKSLQASAAKG